MHFFLTFPVFLRPNQVNEALIPFLDIYQKIYEISPVEKITIPKKSVYRLSLYLSCLQRLKDEGTETVLSNALAAAAGVKSTQVRKDLGYAGLYGRRGIGYNVGNLFDGINGIMGNSAFQPVIVVGVGNLGVALLSYSGFRKEGFEIIAAFDQEPELVRERAAKSGVPVYDSSGLGEYIRDHHVKMVILAVPEVAAQEVADTLVESGVQAVLNFSPAVLQVPENVVVNHVNLAVELESLSYFIS